MLSNQRQPTSTQVAYKLSFGLYHIDNPKTIDNWAWNFSPKDKIGNSTMNSNIHEFNTAMPSKRQFKVAELIKRVLSELLISQKIYIPELSDKMVNINAVTVNKNLRIAWVYVSFFPDSQSEVYCALLSAQSGRFRKALASKVVLKYTPEIRFMRDDRVADFTLN